MLHRALSLVFALAVTALAAPAFADPPNPYDRPWRHGAVSLVIDTHETNDVHWDAIARDGRVAGVIHRATIGNVVDAAYADRAAEARRRGLLWGAYHLGVEGDPVGQADLFLATVGDPTGVLLVLDLEDVDDPRRMNADEALRFIARVRERTGRTPAIYGNGKVVAALSADPRFSAVVREAPLWYARYRDSIEPADLGAWGSYLLWQFASEINCGPRRGGCPYRVPGVASDIDINVFPGDREQLRALWTAGARPAPFAGPFADPPPGPFANADIDEDAEHAIQLEAQRRETQRLLGQANATTCATAPPPPGPVATPC